MSENKLDIPDDIFISKDLIFNYNLKNNFDENNSDFFNSPSDFKNFRKYIFNLYPECLNYICGVYYDKEKDLFIIKFFHNSDEIFNFSREKMFNFMMANINSKIGLLIGDISEIDNRLQVKCEIYEYNYNFIIDTGATGTLFNTREFDKLWDNQVLVKENCVYSGTTKNHYANKTVSEFDIYKMKLFKISDENVIDFFIQIDQNSKDCENLLGINYLKQKLQLSFGFNLK